MFLLEEVPFLFGLKGAGAVRAAVEGYSREEVVGNTPPREDIILRARRNTISVL